MYAYICTCTYICVYAYIYLYICTHLFLFSYIHIYLCTFARAPALLATADSNPRYSKKTRKNKKKGRMKEEYEISVR